MIVKRKERPVWRLIIVPPHASWGSRPRFLRWLETATDVTLAAVPSRLLPLARRAHITLNLTNDGEVRKLNNLWRGVDKPTNVLSFPQFDRRDLAKTAINGGEEPLPMGDIAIARGVVLKEARAENKTVEDHVSHLLIHGILHLFGYDHDTAWRARRMERLEKEILATLGLPDPYQ